jgi:hypothetical protein
LGDGIGVKGKAIRRKGWGRGLHLSGAKKVVSHYLVKEIVILLDNNVGINTEMNFLLIRCTRVVQKGTIYNLVAFLKRFQDLLVERLG